MKLTIEIDDEALRSAIDAKVGQAVSEMTKASIVKKADEIIEKKFDRVDCTGIARQEAVRLLSSAIQSAVDEALGGKFYRRETIQKLTQEAVKEALRENLR